MNAQELILRYRIALKIDEHGQPTGNLVVYRADKAALAAIKAAKPEIVATLKAYGITRCYYGHLHGNAIRYAVQGDVDGIRYKLVSADGLRFCPYRIN